MGRPTLGDRPLTPAERQKRWRAKLRKQQQRHPATLPKAWRVIAGLRRELRAAQAALAAALSEKNQ
jgi:hypothetical protein